MKVSLVSASTFLLLATSSAVSATDPVYRGRLRVYGCTATHVTCGNETAPSAPWNWYGFQVQLPPTTIGEEGGFSLTSVGALNPSDGYTQPANTREELFVDWNFTAAEDTALIRWRTNDDVLWSQNVFTAGGTSNATSFSSASCDVDPADFAARELTVSLDYSLEEGVNGAEEGNIAAVGTDGGSSRRLRYA